MEDGGENKDTAAAADGAGGIDGIGGIGFSGTLPHPSSFQPSKLRWVMCLLQCLSSGMNGFIVQTYVTIWWLVSDTYGVQPEKVYLLALVFAMSYIPGSMLSIYLYAKFGLSHCLIGGALLNFIALWIRCIASLSYNAPTEVDVYGKYDGMYAAANTSALPYPITYSKVARNVFNVQLFAQIVAALAQPLLINAPPRYTRFSWDGFVGRELTFIVGPPCSSSVVFCTESPTIGSPRANATWRCT